MFVSCFHVYPFLNWLSDSNIGVPVQTEVAQHVSQKNALPIKTLVAARRSHNQWPGLCMSAFISFLRKVFTIDAMLNGVNMITTPQSVVATLYYSAGGEKIAFFYYFRSLLQRNKLQACCSQLVLVSGLGPCFLRALRRYHPGETVAVEPLSQTKMPLSPVFNQNGVIKVCFQKYLCIWTNDHVLCFFHICMHLYLHVITRSALCIVEWRRRKRNCTLKWIDKQACFYNCNSIFFLVDC